MEKLVETNIIELTGYINNNHHLLVKEEIPLDPGEVKIFIVPKKINYGVDDISNKDLLAVAKNGGAFKFLDDPKEDIYSLDDGIPVDE